MITFITTVTPCEEYCTKYEIVTQPPSEDNCTCTVTLNQLAIDIVSAINSTRYFETMEIVFQTGTHQATEITGCQPLLIGHINVVIIKGQPNVTIDCLDSLSFYFYRLSSFIIQNIHFKNCICFQGFGIVFDTMQLSTAMAVIIKSNFTNSRLNLNWRDESIKPITKETVLISNSVFENCCSLNPSMPILVMNHSSGILNFTMHKIKVQNNRSPFLFIEEDPINNMSSSSVTLTGQNYFTRNKNFIIVVLCTHRADFKLHFSQTEVYITNNTADIQSNGNCSRTGGESFYDIISSLKSSRFCDRGFDDVYPQECPGWPPITICGGKIQFKHSYAIFSNNGEGFDGIIFAAYSEVVFSDDVHLRFVNNSGNNGGAFSLNSYSTIIFNATTSVISLHFVNNTAYKGGAIYVKDGEDSFFYAYDYGSVKTMKVKSIFDFECNASLVNLTFQDNLAQYGNNIYGGWVDWTVKNGLTTYNINTMMKTLIFIDSNDASSVASEPIRICLCEKGQPNCNITDYSKDIYGYVAHLDLVAVGQRYSPVVAYVQTNNYGFRDNQ